MLVTRANDDRNATLARVERLARGGNLAESRKQLRHWLIGNIRADHEPSHSFGEVLAELAEAPAAHRSFAPVVLRYFAFGDFMPRANSANAIERSIVEFCLGALPDLCTYLKIDPRAQTYISFRKVVSAHLEIQTMLSPFLDRCGDLDGLLVARKSIIGALNHSIVRAYCEPFRLNEVRSLTEALLSHLKRVSALNITLLQDIEECGRVIQEAKEFAEEAHSFLTLDYLLPFVGHVENLLQSFFANERGRFSAKILPALDRSELKKRYPLHEEAREVTVTVPFRNDGPGLATDVRITTGTASSSVVIDAQTVLLGNVPPGIFSFVLKTLVVAPCASFDLILDVEWGEIGTPHRTSDCFEFSVLAQASGVDWRSLEYWSPYSTDVAEGEQFIGREERVRHLASKFLRTPMEPFYITGQKRVGKTSLAKAAASLAHMAESASRFHYHYILWGEVRHVDAGMSMKLLGESIESFIVTTFGPRLRWSSADYGGSLTQLVKLANAAYEIDSSFKFGIILDEFDEIPDSLYISGDLAETFFQNLRALSRCKNVCLSLVGGENMPYIMERQGQKLNNFSPLSLSYFSRTDEWTDFLQLVRRPTEDILDWHDDAVAEIFNVTNGNPYFAKILCASTLKNAVSERDSNITSAEVMRVVDAEVSALGLNSFVHLWQDGIPKPAKDRDVDILRRMRVLVAYGRCRRHRLPATTANIAESKASPNLLDTDILPTLNDFVRRQVMREDGGVFQIELPIFGRWLSDVGIGQLVGDAMTEELANSVLAEENAAMVRSEEIVTLQKTWPTYCGRMIGTDDIRAWFEQVESHREQRLLFELLKRVKMYSEVQVRERLRGAHASLRRILPVPIRKGPHEKRTDILVTYLDGPGKSGASYAALYAEENNIASECVIARGELAEKWQQHKERHDAPSALVVLDDIAATGGTLMRALQTFVAEHAELIAGIPFRMFTIISTAEAHAKITSAAATYDNLDIGFGTGEIIANDQIAFPPDRSGWKTSEDYERAKALCVGLGSKIYRGNPLGFGDLGLLTVFPTTVPNNSLPILHSYSRANSGAPWKPLFKRPTN